MIDRVERNLMIQTIDDFMIDISAYWDRHQKIPIIRHEIGQAVIPLIIAMFSISVRGNEVFVKT